MKEYLLTHPMGKTKYVPSDQNPGETTLKFSPNLCLQRYCTVLNCMNDIANREDIRIVTEFGSNTCRFLYQALEPVPWLEKINLVDVDGDIISSGFISISEPQCNRTLRGRLRPLTAVAYEGNIAHVDHRIFDSDIIIGIEVIEHLTQSDFEKFPQNVFDHIKPKYVIFTTPNRDFNVLFNYKKNTFRHPDHKFEFSRLEFCKWAQKIIERYPSYEFEIYGIGAPPEDVKLDVGFASQMVLFKRKLEPVRLFCSVESYKLVGEILLHCGDSRTPEERHMDKLAKSCSKIIMDSFFEQAHSVYMRQERCKEYHWMDVVPVKMIVKRLENESIITDVDTVIIAIRKHCSQKYEIEMTIALGLVFVGQCDCDSYSHDLMYVAEVKPSSIFYALSSHMTSAVRDWYSGNNSIFGKQEEELCRYVEQFLDVSVSLGEFLLVTVREACELKHSMSFLTPEVVVAHLKSKGIETDAKTFFKIWCDFKTGKYPLEETSFGFVILVGNNCGGSPCKRNRDNNFNLNEDNSIFSSIVE